MKFYQHSLHDLRQQFNRNCNHMLPKLKIMWSEFPHKETRYRFIVEVKCVFAFTTDAQLSKN